MAKKILPYRFTVGKTKAAAYNGVHTVNNSLPSEGVKTKLNPQLFYTGGRGYILCFQPLLHVCYMFRYAIDMLQIIMVDWMKKQEFN